MSRSAEDKNKGQGQETGAGGDVDAVPASPANGEKKRVKCADLKGKKLIVGNGGIVQIDENGFFEVEAKEAERLLTIPGYEKA